MAQETKTLTSGREVTVDYDEDGEPQTVSWMVGLQSVTLSENEVFEIADILNDEDDDSDELAEAAKDAETAKDVE